MLFVPSSPKPNHTTPNQTNPLAGLEEAIEELEGHLKTAKADTEEQRGRANAAADVLGSLEEKVRAASAFDALASG